MADMTIEERELERYLRQRGRLTKLDDLNGLTDKTAEVWRDGWDAHASIFNKCLHCKGTGKDPKVQALIDAAIEVMNHKHPYVDESGVIEVPLHIFGALMQALSELDQGRQGDGRSNSNN